jgi:uncharacterized membrane protein YcaP (DUF421 family)
MSLLQPMFGLEPSVAEKVLRPVLVYAFLVVGLRLAGKRELAQLNAFDLVVLLTISNTVQNAIIGNDNSVTGGLVGAATLLLVNHFVVRILYSHQRVQRVIEGAPAVLIEHGHLQKERLRQELITHAELKAAAHKQGFGSFDEIETATLDPGGSIEFVAKEPTPLMQRHEEIIKRLDQLSAQVAALRA